MPPPVTPVSSRTSSSRPRMTTMGRPSSTSKQGTLSANSLTHRNNATTSFRSKSAATGRKSSTELSAAASLTEKTASSYHNLHSSRGSLHNDVEEPSKLEDTVEHVMINVDDVIDAATSGTDSNHVDGSVLVEVFDEVLKPEFPIPENESAEQFDAMSFLIQLRALSESLQVVLSTQYVQDLEAADKLDKMISSVTGTLRNFQTYASCVQDMLETIRNQMKTVAELVFKKILHPALLERGFDSTINGRRANKALNVAEAELASRENHLNSQLAKTNENLQRATVLMIEADRASTKASLIAEQATEQARLAQAEYDERCRIDQENRKLAEQRRALAERLAAEAERQREQKKRADEERKTAAMKPRVEGPNRDQEDWPLLTYNDDLSRGDHDGGLTCILQTDPGIHQHDSFECQVIDPVDYSFSTLFEDNEELVSSVIRVSTAHTSDSNTSLQTLILVSLPYSTPGRAAMKEPVVKMSNSHSPDDSTWQTLTTREKAFDSFKVLARILFFNFRLTFSYLTSKVLKFVQAEVTSLPAMLCVVLRPRKEYMTLSHRGTKIAVSELDRNITFTNVGLSKREHFTLQLQPIDPEVKARLNSMSGLLTSSAVVSMQWSSRQLTGKISMVVPVPANPVKLAKIAAARASRSKQTSNEEKLAPAIGLAKALELHQKELELESERQNDGDSEVVRKPVPLRWYMGDYDSTKDDDKDCLFLVKKALNGKWVTEENIILTQPKIDLVQFETDQTLNRFIILRTRPTVSSKTAEIFAADVEKILQTRLVCSVIRQRTDAPSHAVHVIVPQFRLDRVLKRLHNQGYGEGPEPSKEFVIREGQRLFLSFHNNIRCCEQINSSLPVVFFNNLEFERHFTVKEVDGFLQKQFNAYRGVVRLSKAVWSDDSNEIHRKPKDDERRMEIVATHQIHIPKTSDSVGLKTSTPQLQHANTALGSIVLNDESGDLRPDVEMLKFLACELGDEWLMLAHWLNIRTTRIQKIKRRAELDGLDEVQTKLEMLASWFRLQQRSVDKVGALNMGLQRCGRSDLARRLTDWKMKGTPLQAAD